MRKKDIFLESCIKHRILPVGFRLGFNLACHHNNDESMEGIKDILNDASSKIMTIVHNSNKQEITKKDIVLKNQMKNLNEEQCKNKLNDKFKRELQNVDRRHRNKIRFLRNENFANIVAGHGGSIKLQSNCFKPRSIFVPKLKRPHRCCRRGKRKKKNSINNESTDENNQIINNDRLPIVLTENVNLTEDQKYICSLSDKFIPTPTAPINVADMMVGTYEWAERLRWQRFHASKEKETLEDGEEKVFVKLPWYTPTGKQAPRGDHALETFIEKCMDDFIDKSNRRRIKDNLTEGQRSAINELKNLPLTHNAVCRFADKSGVTVITSIEEDETRILSDLTNDQQYDVVENDPTLSVMTKIQDWAEKWAARESIQMDVKTFVTDTPNCHPAKCKPLIKTHKTAPYPHRLLLSGSGTACQPLSKFIQMALCHITKHIKFQIVDTKELLRKIDTMNNILPPLPATATLMTCDVVALYPSVDNTMGVPAVKMMLEKHPSPICASSECILEGLDIVLNNNSCYYEKNDRSVVYALPNNGTAMGPCHAPDYVDIFMNELDIKLVEECPVQMISSTAVNTGVNAEELKELDWSRFRDDGFNILPNDEEAQPFEDHLQGLCPGKINWTFNRGRKVEQLDLTISITEEGKLKTDVFSKNAHSYLPPTSCHPRSVFKGLAVSMGRRLRMICSDDSDLKKRLKEYEQYLVNSGWRRDKAKSDLEKGANVERSETLKVKDKSKQKKKTAWVTTYDPRVPSKSKIIRDNLAILYSNPINKTIFPEGSLIGADRKRKNIGELYKPTIPKRFPNHGPRQEGGFFRCGKTCDLCKTSKAIYPTTPKQFVSPWDSRKWNIRDHIFCTSPNIIYIVECTAHRHFMYVGSTGNLKERWRNHKSDARLGKVKKCHVAKHFNSTPHPNMTLVITPIEIVKNVGLLSTRELYWQANVGVFATGGNSRNDIPTVIKNRQNYSI